MVGLAEAAKLCGVSESTMRRRRSDLLTKGAVQGQDGAWRIPIAVLVDAGWMDRVTSPDPPSSIAVTGLATPPYDAPVVAPPEVVELREELARAKERLAKIELELAVAHAVAEERRQALEFERLAFRSLTATSEQAARPTGGEMVPLATTPLTPTPRERWWRRRRSA